MRMPLVIGAGGKAARDAEDEAQERDGDALDDEDLKHVDAARAHRPQDADLLLLGVDARRDKAEKKQRRKHGEHARRRTR